MEATAAAILVQAMLQSSPPLQGSLREDIQKGGPQAGADFLKPYFIAVASVVITLKLATTFVLFFISIAPCSLTSSSNNSAT